MWQASVFNECWADFNSLQMWDVLKFFWQYKSGSLFALFLVVCWFLWWDRNRTQFDGGALPVDFVN